MCPCVTRNLQREAREGQVSTEAKELTPEEEARAAQRAEKTRLKKQASRNAFVSRAAQGPMVIVDMEKGWEEQMYEGEVRTLPWENCVPALGPFHTPVMRAVGAAVLNVHCLWYGDCVWMDVQRTSLVQQIMFCYGLNRRCIAPVWLQLTGLPEGGPMVPKSVANRLHCHTALL